MSTVPKVIKVISVLGLTPFILGVVATFRLSVFEPHLNKVIIDLAISYGALILSFLGGCLFGFECLKKSGPSNLRPWIAILPTLWALIALQISNFSASILAVGFLLVYEFDRKAYSVGIVPTWWLSLRLPLTFSVILALSVIGFYNGH